MLLFKFALGILDPTFSVCRFPSFLKDIFTKYRLLGWRLVFFPFSTLKMPFHCPCLHSFTWEVCCHSFPLFLCMRCALFSLAVYTICPLSQVFSNLILLCLHVVFFMFLLPGFIAPLESCFSLSSNLKMGRVSYFILFYFFHHDKCAL